jgi:hypothetical protein
MSYTDAVKEAYALAKRNNPVFETLEVLHSSASESFKLVKNNADMNLPLIEGGPLHLFQAAGLEIALSGSTGDSLQSMDIVIGNVNLVASDFLKKAIAIPNEPVLLKYRVYLASDLTKPHNDPPLISYLTSVKITSQQVSGSASFADIANKAFLTELYTLNSNPAL